MNSLRSWLIGAVVIAGAVFVWDILFGALPALILLFTGVLFSAGLRPIIDRLAKRIPFGSAVVIVFGVVLTVGVVVAFVLVQPVGVELVKLIQTLPGYSASFQAQLSTARHYFERSQVAQHLASLLANDAGNVVNVVAAHILSGPMLIVTAVGDAVLVVLLAVGWTLSSDELERFVLSLIPHASRADWHGAFKEMATRLSAYVQAVVLNGSVVGIAIGVALAVINVPYALLLGFIVAISQAIPMVGSVISGLVILPVVLLTSGLTKMLIALVIFVVVQAIDQNLLSPVIFGKRVQLSFLLIILATVIGGTLLGIAGAFLAVPAASVLQVLITRIVAPAIRRANGSEATGTLVPPELEQPT